MDGILCDFEAHMLTEFHRLHPEEPFIPPDERRLFYMSDQYENLKPGLAVISVYSPTDIPTDVFLMYREKLF
jgi:hypothetical protein